MKSVALAGAFCIVLSFVVRAETLEYDVPENETQTVTTGFGADVTEIVKKGLGTLVVSNQTSSSFAGTVTVKAGVLQVCDKQSFGFKNTVPIVVEDGATLRMTIASSGQTHQQCPHPITVEGDGADGNGALQSDTTTKTMADKMFENVTLSGDTTISAVGISRVGLGGVLNLNGHTLTAKKVNVDTLIMMDLTVNGGTGGKIVLGSGMKLTIQGVSPFSGTGFINIPASGSMTLYNAVITASAEDWTLNMSNKSSVSLARSDDPDANGNIPFNTTLTGDVTFRWSTSNVPNYGPCMAILGDISGTGKLIKADAHDLILAGNNTYSGGTKVSGGCLIAERPASLPGWDTTGKLEQAGGLFAFMKAPRVVGHAVWSDADVKTAVGNITRTSGTRDFAFATYRADDLAVVAAGFTTDEVTNLWHIGRGALELTGIVQPGTAPGRTILQQGRDGAYTWPQNSALRLNGNTLNLDTHCKINRGAVVASNATINCWQPTSGTAWINCDPAVVEAGEAGSSYYQYGGSFVSMGRWHGPQGCCTGLLYVAGGTFTLTNQEFVCMTSGNVSKMTNKGRSDIIFDDGAFAEVKSFLLMSNFKTDCETVVSVSRKATVKVTRFTRTSTILTNEVYMGFNDGTLEIPNKTGIFNTDSGLQDPNALVIYKGGMTANVTYSGNNYPFLTPALRAPTGQSVLSVTLPDAVLSETYAAPPKLVFSGTGKAVAAVADYDFATRKVKAQAIVTSPGFDCGNDLTCRVLDADGRTWRACTVTLGDGTGGGFTKKGPGFLLLCNTNTYTGATIIEEGTVMNYDKSGNGGAVGHFPTNSPVIVKEGATIYLRYPDATLGGVPLHSLAGGGTVAGAEAAAVPYLLQGLRPTAADLDAGKFLTVEKGIKFAPGCTVKVDDYAGLPAGKIRYPLLKSDVALAANVLDNLKVDAPTGQEGAWWLRLSADRKTIYLARRFGTAIILR